VRQILHKNKRITIGIILIVLDICLYGLFHDVTRLSIFSFLSENSNFSRYISLQRKFALLFSDYGVYKFLNNYCIDILWFLSFQFLCNGILDKSYTFFIVLFGGIISECFQLMFPKLGTFDFADLGLYVLISLASMLLSQMSSLKVKHAEINSQREA